MQEDIEALKIAIDNSRYSFENFGEYESLDKSTMEAIENLIKEYKELDKSDRGKEEYTFELYSEKKQLKDEVKELESDLYSANQIISEQIDLLENSISKDKIREKLSKLEKELDFYAGRDPYEWEDAEFDGEQCDDIAIKIGVLKELLKEE